MGGGRASVGTFVGSRSVALDEPILPARVVERGSGSASLGRVDEGVIPAATIDANGNLSLGPRYLRAVVSPPEGYADLPRFFGVERPLEVGRGSFSRGFFGETDTDDEITVLQVLAVEVLVPVGRLDFGSGE